MALKLRFLAMLLFLLLASTAKANPNVFDVTSATYGAKPGSDVTKALVKAWSDACASPSASKAPTNAGQFTRPDTWVGFQYIDKLTLSGGGTFDGQGALAWGQNDCHKNKNCKPIPINLRFEFITNSRVQDITSLNSKNFHMHVFGCKHTTFQHLTITAPDESRNTDGIHIGASTGINITHAKIGTGDDCVSIGDDSHQITVTDVTCGPGHGISIGSLGRYKEEKAVTGIIVKNCTLTNTQNGVRIKTWPDSPSPSSTASDIHYENIIMVNVSNPILIDQLYCPYTQCDQKPPSKVKISNVSFKNIKGSSFTPLAVKLVCSRGVPCENVKLTDIDLTYGGDQGPLTSLCSNVKPTITGVKKALACATSSLAPLPLSKK
ncbi:exopolygalacturonase-like [Prunus yedoensis var. nudiflora]|uniref:Exopolygalacturonase-like n=1 Tax=Prunus yedoensis var. nudiflora TaxID=2094558 RepID=A0A314UIH4_PRUYE|nr:exopolygalacturonase-like [Prunus yedoensis var. nudiflora]